MDVYTVERYYLQKKSIVNLKKLIVKIKNYNNGKYCDHFVLIYSRDASVNEDVEILPMVIQNILQQGRTYAHQIKFLKWEDQLLSSGHSVADIYDKVLEESGGPLNSQSQSSDKSQIYRPKNKK